LKSEPKVEVYITKKGVLGGLTSVGSLFKALFHHPFSFISKLVKSAGRKDSSFVSLEYSLNMVLNLAQEEITLSARPIN